MSLTTLIIASFAAGLLFSIITLATAIMLLTVIYLVIGVRGKITNTTQGETL